VGLPIRTRLADNAHAREGPGVDLTALVEGNLAFLDEPNRTCRREYVHPHTTARTATIERGDAYALAILEYDLSYPATVTNAVGYLRYEWQAKPARVVRYEGVFAGTGSMPAPEPVAAALTVLPAAESLNIPLVAGRLDEQRRVKPAPEILTGVDAVLDESSRLAWPLAARREEAVAATARTNVACGT
jgi:NAD(P)H-dependent FMN reductase